MEFYDKYLEDIKAQVGAGKSIALYHKYSAARSHFVNFLHTKYGRRDLMPSELTHLIIHDFEIYLKTVVSLKSNSATKTLKFFKTVVIFAQKCGVMTHDPFLNHHFHLEPVDRGFLTDEEIQRIMQKDFEIPRLEMVRDVFIFSCFCGLAYIDVAHLTQENIITLDNRPWIIINRQKTNVQSNIPLLEIPQMILDKYKGKTKDDRLLPVLSNQKINAYLNSRRCHQLMKLHPFRVLKIYINITIIQKPKEAGKIRYSGRVTTSPVSGSSSACVPKRSAKYIKRNSTQPVQKKSPPRNPHSVCLVSPDTNTPATIIAAPDAPIAKAA